METSHLVAQRRPSKVALRTPLGSELRVTGLFAGIGGIELGLHAFGHKTEFLCEVDPAAQAVLVKRFADIPLTGDIRTIDSLPSADLVAAGFPCQDLSQAGRTAGIGGKHSGLVGEVFRLLNKMERQPRWLLLENVPFMLQLDRGNAMRFLIDSLDALGYSWAYRLVDTRSFGLPQRRQRVLLLASKTEDAREVLLTEDLGEPPPFIRNGFACGFYWTEGTRGLGWAVDAVPTLKGGSTIGIPSPPAILTPEGNIVTPDIRDAERLQGFPADWTKPVQDMPHGRKGLRWRLVGNAVSVPVSAWLGGVLRSGGQPYNAGTDTQLSSPPWPKAAWGRKGKAFNASVSVWPRRDEYRHLSEFLEYPRPPLSARATAGFFSRAEASTLRFPEGFLDSVARHLDRMRAEEGVA